MSAIIQTGFHIFRQPIGIISVAHIHSNNYCSRVENNAYNLASLKRGTGGRSSFNGICATVFGASGFVGRYVCNKLGKIGTQIIIPYRADPYEVLRLKLCGDLGQVLFQPYHLKDELSIEKALHYSNVVINLVGRDWETKNFKFNDVHVTGARALARAARKAGVKRFIHLSALNAAEQPERHILPKGSGFLASKWCGEKAVLEEFPEATIIRPADVYGQEDRFLRYYAHNWRRQGQWMPLYKKGECTVKQPVYVSDLAAGIVNAMNDPETQGKIYQAVGPRRYYLSDLVDWFYRVMRKSTDWGYVRYDMKWDPLFKIKVSFTERICPGNPVGNLHWERIERECVTDTVVQGLPTLEDLGVCLTAMEDQVPWELRPFTHGMYHDRDMESFADRPAPPKIIC